MKRIIKCFKYSLLIFLLCTFSYKAHSKTLNIVTTTPDLKSIAKSIGGNKVKAISLSTGYQDPHFVQAKPSTMLKVKKADLFIKVGLDLEIGWEQLIIDGSRNRKIRFGQPGYLDVSTGVMKLQVPTTKIDRSMGDIHPYGNPHYWTDPLNGKIIAKNIFNRLSMLSPSDSAYYKENFLNFNKKINEALFGKNLVNKIGGEKLCTLLSAGKLNDFLKAKNLESELGGWLSEVKPFIETKIITYHNSWPYFAKRFGFDIIDQLEPKPGIPPNPTHIREVINKIKLNNAKIILMEPFYDIKPAKLVSENTGINIVVVPNSVGGDPAAKDYISLIDTILNESLKSLKK